MAKRSNSNDVMPCLMQTWHLHESQLYYWLLKQTEDEALSFDLLQETFLKGLQQKESFCDIQNQKAWLYRVAYHLFIDNVRHQKSIPSFDIHEVELSIENEESPAVASLAQCLPKALMQLNAQDRAIIQACDLEQMPQYEFAKQQGLTLEATKSRIQRARQKLKKVLQSQCQIRFDDNARVCCFIPQ